MMVRALLADRRAATAAEFGLVLPLLMLLLLGMIDTGRWMWEVNQAEKATQYGARMAVVTDVLAPGMASASYVGVGGLTQGDVIPASALGEVTCDSTGCTCTTNPCPTLGTTNSAAFTAIVARMQTMKPDITASNVSVTYRGAGLGYAGDPNGMEISPLVTVELSGVQFRPASGLLLLTLTLPAFRTTLTAEDMSGTGTN
jgi:hypothetical protein